MQHFRRAVVISVLFFLSLGGPALAGDTLLEFEFNNELGWYYQNDVGMLLVYADGQLQLADLLADENVKLPALKVPDLSAPGSVVPVARTGLVLIPRATKPDGVEYSCAIDTLGSKIAWESAPLPSPEVVFSYPDAGLAVIRSFDGDGTVYALNLSTGETVWEHKKRATIIWARGNHIRFLSGSDLVTLDTVTGETVRTDTLSIPKENRLYALKNEDVIIFWKNKFLEGFSLPPAPPTPAAPARSLWKFQAAGPMVNLCIKGGGCDIRRVNDDLLMVSSARHRELVRISTGERLLHVKYGMFPAPVVLSPSGRLAAVAARNQLEIYDATSEAQLHAIRYPKGDEGMKTLKYLRWIDEDTVMTVYPDKKGNPKKMTGFSATAGKQLWSFVLPEVANYALTAEQRAKLIGRITLSLVATAVSVSNPMSVGGMNYAAIVVPNLNVTETLDAGASIGRGASGDETGQQEIFKTAMERADKVKQLTESRSDRTHFVTGAKGKYEILEINLKTGDRSKAALHQADKVHSISPLTPLGIALTVQDNNRKLQVVALD